MPPPVNVRKPALKSARRFARQFNYQQAVSLQLELAGRIITQDALGPVRTVLGVDVGFEEKGRIARAAAVALEFPSLKQLATTVARLPVSVPYVPGLLSFRELPVLLAAIEKLTVVPDLILCDGQGYAHPRHFGIACHLGLTLDIPALGVGKSRLVGEHDPVPDQRGAWSLLVFKGAIVGAALRTRAGVKPVFVSAGHRIGLDSAVGYVMACTTRYRLPETTRLAHKLASW